MKGYDPNDPVETRLYKANCFWKSMIRKGQDSYRALKIASDYYHVIEEEVEQYRVPDDVEVEDIYFLIDGWLPVSATEILDEGQFH